MEADCQGGPALVCDPAQTAVKYPAAYPWVMAVVATDFDDDVTAYSLTGPQVDVAAPGGSKATGIRILSTNTGGGYGWEAGPVKRPRMSPGPSHRPCSSNRGSPSRRCVCPADNRHGPRVSADAAGGRTDQCQEHGGSAPIGEKAEEE